MAWTYSDWITQSTLTTRLSRLRLHIQEVSAKIDIEIAGDGKSRASATLGRYYEKLIDQEAALAKRVQAQGLDGGSGSVSQVRILEPDRLGDDGADQY